MAMAAQGLRAGPISAPVMLQRQQGVFIRCPSSAASFSFAATREATSRRRLNLMCSAAGRFAVGWGAGPVDISSEISLPKDFEYKFLHTYRPNHADSFFTKVVF